MPISRWFLATALLVASDARAENEPLVKARDAVAAVRYNDARALLVEALHRGDNGPGELAEIYRLSASTAIVLGQADAAEQYYRRWLALVPDATLPDSVAPKLRAPFVSAQAFMAAHGRLSVKAQQRGDQLDVVVESDPLAMIAAVAVGDTRRPIGADRAAHFDVAAEPIRVLDEHGNTLVAIATAEIAIVEAARLPEPPPVRDASLPLYRSTLAWSIGAGAFALAGGGFALAARSAHADVVEISANPGEHFASELADARDRRDRHALFANIGFVAAGACAVTALVMFATRPDTPAATTTAFVPSPTGVSLVMSRAF